MQAMAELRDAILEAARSAAHHQRFMQLDTFGQLADITERLEALVEGRDVPNGSMRRIIEHTRHVNGTLSWLTVSHLKLDGTPREIDWEQYVDALIRIARTGIGTEVIDALRHTFPMTLGERFSRTIAEAAGGTDWEQLRRDTTLLCQREHREILRILMRRRGENCDIHDLAVVARGNAGRDDERRLLSALCSSAPHAGISELHQVVVGLAGDDSA